MDDLIKRLRLYEREYGPLPSLWLHPETPGYTHGMLIRDTRDAADEIERLALELDGLQARFEVGRLQNEALKAEIERLRAALSEAESEARRFAMFYPEASDGRNTFVILADRIADLPAEKTRGE